jgi:hypothetical protein
MGSEQNKEPRLGKGELKKLSFSFFAPRTFPVMRRTECSYKVTKEEIKMEALRTYDVVFHTHGFRPEDLEDWEWEKFKGFFMAMYGTFAEAYNAKSDQIDNIWRHYEETKSLGNEAAVMLMEMAMDIAPGTTQVDWAAKWMEKIAMAVDKTYSPFTELQGYIFRDGDLPVYGVRFTKHPGWTMDFSLKETEHSKEEAS